MQQQLRLNGTVPTSALGQRLDQALAEMFPEYSRSRIKEWILAGQVRLDGEVCERPREKVIGEQAVEIAAEITLQVEAEPEAIDLNIVFEDKHLLVINKPAGLVVHPGAGNRQGTLLNALLGHAPQLAQLPRAGIVHRLDKDTTGLMVVAKTLEAHSFLVEKLQARDIHREYQAVVNGTMVAGGLVDEPIGRHPTKRVNMAVVPKGKPAVTHYRVMEKFRAHTHLRLKLESGRTHQIRVHMAHIHHPLVGDPQYGGRPKPPKNAGPELLEQLRRFPRQALHAVQLGLEHPQSGEWLSWQAPIPEDFERLLQDLRSDNQQHQRAL